MNVTKQSVFDYLSRRRVLIAITIVPATIVLSFTLVVPILWAFYASFHEISAYNPEMVWIGLENFETIVNDPGLHDSMVRSVIYAVGSLAIQLPLGLAFALAINEQFKFKSVVQSVFLLPYLVPTVVLGYIALWMGNVSWGIINILLVDLGFIGAPIAWFGSLDLSMFAVILTGSWKFTPFIILFLLARLQSIPDNYYESAKMSGANSYQCFRDITLPHLKSVIFIIILLRGIWMFNKFDIIWVLTRGGPGAVTTTAPVYAYKTGFQDLDLGEAAAISVFLFLILVGVAIVYFVVFNPAKEVRSE